MSDEYTPGTNRVRDAYVQKMRLAFLSMSAGEYADEFDRWFADRDARIRAEVIDWIENAEGSGGYRRIATLAREHFGLTEGG